MKRKILLSAGIVLLLSSIICLAILNYPTKNETTFRFSSLYEGKTDILEASLWQVERAQYAVLICPGYSCDRQKWRPFAGLFVENGITTMTFDYSGQGASFGSIGFDNAKTDHVPIQINDALIQLNQKTSIPYDHIILMGHSMGGRAILKLMTLDSFELPIENIILFSPEVDYVFSAQANFFAGTLDAEEEPWKSYHPGYLQGKNVYLYGSTGDDIVAADSVRLLYRHLGGIAPEGNGAILPAISQINQAGSTITLGIEHGVLHSYMMYSPRFARFANAAISSITGNKTLYPAIKIRLIYAGWLCGLTGILLLLIGLNPGCQISLSEEVLPTLLNTKAFLLWKLFLWLPGLIVAFLLCCITVIMPFGSPVMNSIYMCAIAGYGLTMLLFYHKGWVKGVAGRLPRISFSFQVKKSIPSFLITICLFVYFVYALRSGMYRLLPCNMRLFWLMFATTFMTIGYYVSGCEADMLHRAGASLQVKLLYNLVQYVALFLLVLFYLLLRSYSGLIGQIQNMLLMYIFCIPVGNFLRFRTGNRFVGALVSAFTFQGMMITSAALISLF